MKQVVFAAVFEKLRQAEHPSLRNVAVAASIGGTPANGSPKAASISGDPKRFLLQVMNDDSAPLALRVEAAKALLQHSVDLRPPQSD
jgi:hypothetical protein